MKPFHASRSIQHTVLKCLPVKEGNTLRQAAAVALGLMDSRTWSTGREKCPSVFAIFKVASLRLPFQTGEEPERMKPGKIFLRVKKKRKRRRRSKSGRRRHHRLRSHSRSLPLSFILDASFTLKDGEGCSVQHKKSNKSRRVKADVMNPSHRLQLNISKNIWGWKKKMWFLLIVDKKKWDDNLCFALHSLPVCNPLFFFSMYFHSSIMPKSLHVFLWLGFIETLGAVIWLFQQSCSLSWFCTSEVRGWEMVESVGGQTEAFQKRCVWFVLDVFYFILQGFCTTSKNAFLLKVPQLAMKTSEAHGPEWELCFLVRLTLWLFHLFIAALTATAK